MNQVGLTKRSIYMFEGLALTGHEGYDLQKLSVNGKLDVVQHPTNLGWGKVFKLSNKDTGGYCYVFSDEGAQFSMPYPDLNTAIEALESYANSL